MSSTLSPRRRRGVRAALFMAAIFGVAAFYAAPALANPCPNEANAFLLTGSSFTSGAHMKSIGSGSQMANVTLDVTKTTTSVSFSLTDNSATTDWLATRVWVNPGQPGEKEYPVDTTSDETDNAYSPAVTHASGLTPTSGDVTGLKVCLVASGVSAVSLRSVTAKQTAKGVTVNWRTASEIDVAGYNVYGLVHGKRVKLSSRIIASKGAGANSYAFHYRTPKGQRAPTQLWLQSIDMDGSRQWHAARVIR